jgi:branched-chain amino acid transport system substrate-binding protein
MLGWVRRKTTMMPKFSDEGEIEMNVKKIMIMPLMILLLVFTSACGMFSSSSKETLQSQEKKGNSDVIKIGVIVAETGPASTLGKTEANTIKMIQKQLDETGQINGKKIELVMRDYETDDTKAVIAMDKLISDGIVAIIGATQASTTNAILPKAEKANLPLLTLAPINTDIENVYNIPPSSATVASKMIDYLVENKISKVAWVNAKDAFGVDGLPHFEPLAKEKNIEIVAHEEFDATASDMTIQLTNVREKNPEAVIVWSRTPGAGIVARNFKALGFEVPMIQSHASANQGFLDQVKSNNENIFVVAGKLNVVTQLEDSEYKSLVEEYVNPYEKEYNEPTDFFGAHSYDAVQLVIKAVEEGNFTSSDINNYLQNELKEYQGISGKFDLTKPIEGPQADGVTVLSIEDGTWKYTE